jgi:histone deacetylase complex subunit SAP18
MNDINRERVCPFLLRVFYKEGEYNNLDDLVVGRFPSTRELHMYTWMDASLKELTTLIKDVIEIKKPNPVFNFSIVYPDSRGRLQRKPAGSVGIRKTADDDKSLQQLKFTIGDYIDINIGYEK